MRLTVFGATGRTGVTLVRQALDRDHEVRALVRAPARASALPADGERLVLVEGDLLDPAAVRSAVDGGEAVVNVSGPAKGSPADLQQRATAAIVDAMTAEGIRRLVTLTGAGVSVPWDRPKPVDRVFGILLRLVQRQVLADSEAAVRAVRASDLDWTVVRVPRLTDAPPRGRWRVAPGVGAGTGTQLSRADLAAFLLDTVESGGHVAELPVVSW
ncbi:MAG: NAD(P)H-binding protein [Euzebyaceae bacterium]|nr:NAD(P)H-binding protein [Euzebyaceae bacterium]